MTVDASTETDAYLYDRTSRLLRLLSRTPAGTSGDGQLEFVSISDDGTLAAFASTATNLVAGDTNRFYDVFVVPTR